MSLSIGSGLARRPAWPGVIRALALFAAFCGLYSATLLLGFALLVAMFKLGVMGALGVMFYRGLVVIGLVAVATLALSVLALGRWGGRWLEPRDALGAAAMSLAFNLCFFVLAPVTVDRSISIFMLGRMDMEAAHAFTPGEMRDAFTSVYVDGDRQIERRLAEQKLSGDVEDVGGRYRITARGRALIAAARGVSWMFDGDPRFVTPAGVSAPTLRPPLPGLGKR